MFHSAEPCQAFLRRQPIWVRRHADAVLRCRADYLTKVVVSGKSSKELKVSEIMTREEVLKTVTPADTVLAAMELMIDHNFRHVPVVGAAVGTPGCAIWRSQPVVCEQLTS